MRRRRRRRKTHGNTRLAGGDHLLLLSIHGVHQMCLHEVPWHLVQLAIVAARWHRALGLLPTRHQRPSGSAQPAALSVSPPGGNAGFPEQHGWRIFVGRPAHTHYSLHQPHRSHVGGATLRDRPSSRTTPHRASSARRRRTSVPLVLCSCVGGHNFDGIDL